MSTVHVGIDIGTTNISLIALSLHDGNISQSWNKKNRRINTVDSYAYLQSPPAIEGTVRELLGKVSAPIASICVTGQVHGILYYDINGEAVSPLYTWLDQRGVEAFGATSSQEMLFEKTGVLLPPGYGFLTHYTNKRLGVVPHQAVGFCGIIEYITNRLIGAVLPYADSSCLGTYGGFDPISSSFDQQLLREIFGSTEYQFLETSQPLSIAGHTPEGVPVAYGVGDNQAGFFGMVSSWDRSALLSIGTSGQISLFSKTSECPNSMELRPFFDKGYLFVGATLTAGKAYESLQQLFASTIRAGGFEIEDEAVFSLMKEAATALGSTSLQVDPRFSGSRKNPAIRGTISNIELHSLTMGDLVLATITGIVNELRDFGFEATEVITQLDSIVATGNAIRNNHLFQQVLTSQFNLPVHTVTIADGAGFGAALIGAVAAGALSEEARAKLAGQVIRT
ncbi:MAG TPA: FGGY-family carbohydrate kinase [Sphaerochaeta sp.]|nr:FGGY-family carbohydrate kinase [Sphaerochaeta sp.]